MQRAIAAVLTNQDPVGSFFLFVFVLGGGVVGRVFS